MTTEQPTEAQNRLGARIYKSLQRSGIEDPMLAQEILANLVESVFENPVCTATVLSAMEDNREVRDSWMYVAAVLLVHCDRMLERAQRFAPGNYPGATLLPAYAVEDYATMADIVSHLKEGIEPRL